jgi:hypothetical protein
MRKIDKDYSDILSTKYKSWVDTLEANGTKHPLSRTYYDDVAMELYRCQDGVCAYTERWICPRELYDGALWVDGKYVTDDSAEYRRVDHAGEMDHYDPLLKEDQYWLWNNLFMIDATVNSRKDNKPVLNYLKPDLDDYSPEKYFEYDEKTHRYIPNTDLDNTTRTEIQYMIDNVLFLNHGVVRNDRRDLINDIKQKQKNNTPYKIDRFFTALIWCLE